MKVSKQSDCGCTSEYSISPQTHALTGATWPGEEEMELYLKDMNWEGGTSND